MGVFKNTLLKKYSDVLYRSNAMVKYFTIRQEKDENTISNLGEGPTRERPQHQQTRTN